ncbi:hypothetical protein [Cytobacillus praedii]|uniref:hypothetical protein n=1 Tax=Cytobacillus praedii TaxID=1742358 RepID=UPI002E1AE52B|nr:hypothetical protein [Cytobacillus praedii]
MSRDKLKEIAQEGPPVVAKFARLMLEVNDAVLEERESQNEKWGNQRHDYGTWLKIAVEEVGEVAQAMQAAEGWGKKSDAQNLYKECVQASAVFQAIAEQVKEERGL